jgi:hypothetical protein
MAAGSEQDGNIEKSRQDIVEPASETGGNAGEGSHEKPERTSGNQDDGRSSITLSTLSSSDDPERNPIDLVRTLSNPPPVFVPRSKRRGLFGQLAILPEAEDPRHYARKTKWLVTSIIAFAGMAAPIGSAIFFRMSFPAQADLVLLAC